MNTSLTTSQPQTSRTRPIVFFSWLMFVFFTMLTTNQSLPAQQNTNSQDKIYHYAYINKDNKIAQGLSTLPPEQMVPKGFTFLGTINKIQEPKEPIQKASPTVDALVTFAELTFGTFGNIIEKSGNALASQLIQYIPNQNSFKGDPKDPFGSVARNLKDLVDKANHTIRHNPGSIIRPVAQAVQEAVTVQKQAEQQTTKK
ncbi:MAG: hypothetical protein FWG02_06575 [Holophagaceae bacterium]|nr:hypothetical protein [Holophagaceae bacterium]